MVMELETEVILENKEEFIPIHRLRYELFVRMDYRALVSRKCCEEVFVYGTIKKPLDYLLSSCLCSV